jgi:signal transduction histidine kinase
MGQLAAGIAHEINTPTQYVGDNTRFLQEGFSGMMEILESYRRLEELVRKGEGLDDALEEVRSRADSLDLDFLTEEIPASLRQSLEGLERVTRIVQAMKKFSHPGNDGQVSIDLNAVIENALTVCRNEWKYVADLQTDLQADLPEIQGLAGELNQVLLNVLINAAHAVEDRYGRDSEKGLIHISTRADGDYAEIRIRDTGCGIPAEHREKIFDLFYTTKEAGKGTGQGLAIARNVVVDKHGGSIDFTSETGEGTTFVIRLPFEGRSEDAPPVQEPSLEAVDA